MGAVGAWLGSDLQRKARSMVVLALVAGIAGGSALAALAGARRTDTAMARFLDYAHSPDAFVGADDPSVYPRIAQLPQVARWQEGAYLLMKLVAPSAQGQFGGAGAIAVVRNPTAYRPRLLAGRFPHPDRVDEALLNTSAATTQKLGVGATVRLQGWAPEDAEAALRGSDVPPRGPATEVHVVGVARFPSEISTSPPTPGVNYTGTGFVLLTPAFFERYHDTVATAGGVGMSVRLRHGASDFPAFRAAVLEISPGAQIEQGSDDLTAAGKVRHATRLEALALVLFGAMAAVVALVLVSLALARQSLVDAQDYSTLGAMGMTRAQLVSVGAIRGALIGGAAAILAVGLAFGLSARMPIGIARQAEVDPGVSFDATVLLVGAAVWLVAITASAAVTTWRAARTVGGGPGPVAAGGERASYVADRLTRAGAPASAVVGVRMALETGRGATAVPVRATLVSATAAFAVLVATFTFGASFTRLTTRPVLQGWNWDVAVGNPHSDDVSATAIPRLRADPDVAGVSGLAGPADARLGRHPASLFAVDLAEGAVLPPFSEGRGPRAPDEIALAAKDLRAAHGRVGDLVTVSAGGQPQRMRVVGRMVMSPAVMNDQVDLGRGALVTTEGLRALGAEAPENVFLVRLRRGVDRGAAVERLRSDFPGTVLGAVRPSDLENLRRVDRLPSVLAALVAAVALLTVGHMLVSSVRRRRRDVAILRTMGFVRRQVSAAVAWQATTVATIGLAVGVPLGILAGRWAWAAVADQLGVLFEPVVPALEVLAVVAGGLLVANALASVPGLLARRTQPAQILRTE